MNEQQQQPERIMFAVLTSRAVQAAIASGVRFWGATEANGRVIEFPESVRFEESKEYGGYRVFVGELCVGLLYYRPQYKLVPWMFVAPTALPVVA